MNICISFSLFKGSLILLLMHSQARTITLSRQRPQVLSVVFVYQYLNYFKGRENVLILRRNNGAKKFDDVRWQRCPRCLRRDDLLLESRCQFHQRVMCSLYAHRSQKRQLTLLTWLCFFVHSGSTRVKAGCRTLMKLSPDELNFKTRQRTYEGRQVFVMKQEFTNFEVNKVKYISHNSSASYLITFVNTKS